jgi:hypothetical protein
MSDRDEDCEGVLFGWCGGWIDAGGNMDVERGLGGRLVEFKDVVEAGAVVFC